jgi:hypothetical protein
MATAVAVVGSGQLPASADDTVVVHGTAFPDLRAAQLTLVGCESLYQRSTEFLQPYISRLGRLGDRSLKYDLAGGNAIGTLSYVDSMTDTTVAGLQVFAASGAQGVAYAGYQDPDAEGYDLWVGRAPLVSGGGWQPLDATGLTYTWTQYDMSTGRATGETAEAPATVPDFAEDHGGDGAGFYMLGFGCDGAPFYMDGWQVGAPGSVTTYDLEALTTRATIRGSARTIAKGDEVTLRGSVRDGQGRRLRAGTMILEAKPLGGSSFLPVQVVDAAATDPSVTVSPTASTIYRWRFVERPLATGSISPEFRVHVARGGGSEPETEAPATPPPTPQQPTAPETTEPAPPVDDGPTEPPATPDAPPVTTTPEPTTPPTPEATVEPSATP